MDTELFYRALDIALSAYFSSQQANFAVAIRVAQSLLEASSRTFALLESALQTFPSADIPQLLTSARESIQQENGAMNSVARLALNSAA